jgi:hypothetical protein
MDMIGHQAVTDHRHPVKFNVFPQRRQVGRSIRIAIQDEAPVISTLGQMVKWCGTSTATTRASRPIAKKRYQEIVCTLQLRVKMNGS